MYCPEKELRTPGPAAPGSGGRSSAVRRAGLDPQRVPPAFESCLRAELDRLANEPVLAASPKLLKLLGYLFGEQISGRAGHISQYSIAFDCYGLARDFDPASNTVVRAHARRLRKILKELAPPDAACRILMDEKGYCLRFDVAETALRAGRAATGFRRPLMGILALDLPEQWGTESWISTALGDEIMAAISTHDVVIPHGPFPRQTLAACAGQPLEFARRFGLDFLLDGGWSIEGGRTLVSLRILDGESGTSIWCMRDEWPPDAATPDRLRLMARRLVDRIVGDWGAIPNRIARQARLRAGGHFDALQAVVMARHYLTHFHFEHLDDCVRLLREAASQAGDAAIPATLAVLLNAACAFEPRWRQPMDRGEIRQLAARAARLDPENPWTRLALAVSAMIDGRRVDLLEMGRRVDREPDSPRMLVGALGTLLCAQALDVDLGRRMIARYRHGTPHYPRLVHLTLALVAVTESDTASAREELARYGVTWGWAFPLIQGACAALDGDPETAVADWSRVLEAFPDFPGLWRETVGTQWHGNHLQRIFDAFESAGVRTGCL